MNSFLPFDAFLFASLKNFFVFVAVAIVAAAAVWMC
jgi:hypothetical protein